MSRYYSYVNTTLKIISEFKGEEPLSRFLKGFFSKSKKYGSKDRRIIAMLCYHYYRAAKIINSSDLEEQILIAHFLCCESNSSILADLKPSLHKHVDGDINKKLLIVSENIETTSTFPFKNLLSDAVDLIPFSQSMLIQPSLFVRIRPGFENIVLQKLKTAESQFEKISTDTISFENSTKIEEIFEIGKEVIIQDLNSQNVGKFIEKHIPIIKKTGLSIWDCCSASGGKSIMIFDQNSTIDLTVSDIRNSILQNLKERFALAGIHQYHSFVADLAFDNSVLPIPNNFEVIIADVPCTGSGTWSRTPEQLYFFNEANINYFTDLQKNILKNTSKYLAEGGYFILITCSVFLQENEENVKYLQNILKLKLVTFQLLEGYNSKADSMFVAIFLKV